MPIQTTERDTFYDGTSIPRADIFPSARAPIEWKVAPRSNGGVSLRTTSQNRRLPAAVPAVRSSLVWSGSRSRPVTPDTADDAPFHNISVPLYRSAGWSRAAVVTPDAPPATPDWPTRGRATRGGAARTRTAAAHNPGGQCTVQHVAFDVELKNDL